jgi:hypothetical protein
MSIDTYLHVKVSCHNGQRIGYMNHNLLHKQIFYIILLIITPIVGHSLHNRCAATETSRTVFVHRSILDDPLWQATMYTYYLRHIIPEQSERPHTTILSTTFFQHSTHADDIASYILPNKKPCMTICENGCGTLGSLWLDLMAPHRQNFASTVCIQPTRSLLGFYYGVQWNLAHILEHTWLRISTAIVQVKQAIHPHEKTFTPGSICGFTTALQAFNNPEWNVGRITNQTLTKTAMTGIQLRFGYDFYQTPTRDVIAGFYTIFDIPTQSLNSSSAAFSPSIAGRYPDLGFGLNADYSFWRHYDHSLTFLADFRYSYSFTMNDKRLFDLCNGPWSRYVQVVHQNNRSCPLPAVNFLALPVRITPNSSTHVWTTLHYAYCNYHIEAGYIFWWRNAEQVTFSCPELPPIGIYDMRGQCTEPTSSSKATISQSILPPNQLPQDAQFIPIRLESINRLSGVHPAVHSSRFLLSFFYSGQAHDLPGMIGGGIAYEIPGSQAAIHQWIAWFKMALSF